MEYGRRNRDCILSPIQLVQQIVKKKIFQTVSKTYNRFDHNDSKMDKKQHAMPPKNPNRTNVAWKQTAEPIGAKNGP